LGNSLGAVLDKEETKQEQTVEKKTSFVSRVVVGIALVVLVYSLVLLFGIILPLALSIIFSAVFGIYLFFAINLITEQAGSLRSAELDDGAKEKISIEEALVKRELPKVTVIVPCYEEEKVIPASVSAMAKVRYDAKKLQVIYAYDKSSDQTENLLRSYEKISPIRVIENRGPSRSKADAINTALSIAEGEIIAIFDADHEPEPDSLLKAVQHFKNNPTLGCVQGRCRVHRTVNLLTELVRVEFNSIYRVNHYGRTRSGGVPLFCGSNGYWRKKTLLELKGFDRTALVEDIDVSLRALERGWQIKYDHRIVSYETAPETWGSWFNQRYRWARGWIQVGIRHIPKLLKNGRVKRSIKFNSILLLIGALVAPFFTNLIWLLPLFYLANISFWTVVPSNLITTSICLGALWTDFSLPIALDYKERGERRVKDLKYFLFSTLYFGSLSFIPMIAAGDQLTRSEKEWVKTKRGAGP
jgi:1,2-diacylglycerol 3-beta-glucosyltransferase